MFATSVGLETLLVHKVRQVRVKTLTALHLFDEKRDYDVLCGSKQTLTAVFFGGLR